MKLERIITMANKKVEIEFLAMERSLRATGCKLPIWVIPYNDEKFELPEGSTWWLLPELDDWLKANKAMPKLRKYQCFLIDNYQFVDADICFLKNPEHTLKPYEGFITSCLHWSNPIGTFTEDSLQFMKNHTSLWPGKVFNSGQFASSAQLYDFKSLTKIALTPKFKYTCIDLWRDQPGINMLAFASKANIINLTLPPYNMQSTWAGDYTENDPTLIKNNDAIPYLIHWAGMCPSINDSSNKVDKIFSSYLSIKEKEIWKREVELRKKEAQKYRNSPMFFVRKLKRALQVLKE